MEAAQARCQTFGFSPGSNAFAGCMERSVTTAERCAKERSAAQLVYYSEISRLSARGASTIAATNAAGQTALRGLSPECQR